MVKKDAAALYEEIREKQEQARARRLAEGKPRFTDLDADGVREYKRRKQAERRAKLREQAERLGHPPLTADVVAKALSDAIFQMISQGDGRVIPVIDAAAANLGVDRGQMNHVVLSLAVKRGRKKNKS